MAVFGSNSGRGPSTAFKVCDDCSGRGFLRSGDFVDRKFFKCKVCGGIGQIYLEQPPPPPPDKLKPNP